MLFKQKWYGQSSLFSKVCGSGTDHFFKDMMGNFIHINKSEEFLNLMRSNNGKVIEYESGKFYCCDKNIEEVEALLKQSRYSVRTNLHITNNIPFDGEVYQKYLTLTKKVGLDPLTQRRVSGLINELDTQGLVSAKLVNHGRYGRTKNITLMISNETLQETIEEDELIGQTIQ